MEAHYSKFADYRFLRLVQQPQGFKALSCAIAGVVLSFWISSLASANPDPTSYSSENGTPPPAPGVTLPPRPQLHDSEGSGTRARPNVPRSVPSMPDQQSDDGAQIFNPIRRRIKLPQTQPTPVDSNELPFPSQENGNEG